jgi:hypothetical protein
MAGGVEPIDSLVAAANKTNSLRALYMQVLDEGNIYSVANDEGDEGSDSPLEGEGAEPLDLPGLVQLYASSTGYVGSVAQARAYTKKSLEEFTVEEIFGLPSSDIFSILRHAKSPKAVAKSTEGTLRRELKGLLGRGPAKAPNTKASVAAAAPAKGGAKRRSSRSKAGCTSCGAVVGEYFAGGPDHPKLCRHCSERPRGQRPPVPVFRPADDLLDLGSLSDDSPGSDSEILILSSWDKTDLLSFVKTGQRATMTKKPSTSCLVLSAPHGLAAFHRLYGFSQDPAASATIPLLSTAEMQVAVVCLGGSAVRRSKGVEVAVKRDTLIRRLRALLWPPSEPSSEDDGPPRRSSNDNWRQPSRPSRSNDDKRKGGVGSGRGKAKETRFAQGTGDQDDDFSLPPRRRIPLRARPDWEVNHAETLKRVSSLHGVRAEPYDRALAAKAGYENLSEFEDNDFSEEKHSTRRRRADEPRRRDRGPSSARHGRGLDRDRHRGSRRSRSRSRRRRSSDRRDRGRSDDREDFSSDYDSTSDFSGDRRHRGSSRRKRGNGRGPYSGANSMYSPPPVGPLRWNAALMALIMTFMMMVNEVIAQEVRRNRGTGSLAHRVHRQVGNVEYQSPEFFARLSRTVSTGTMQAHVRTHPVFLSTSDNLRRTRREMMGFCARIDFLMSSELPRLCCCRAGRHGRPCDVTISSSHPLVQALANSLEIDIRRFMAIVHHGENVMAGRGGRWDVAEVLESESTAEGSTLVNEENLRDAQKAVKLRQDLGQFGGKKK